MMVCSLVATKMAHQRCFVDASVVMTSVMLMSHDFCSCCDSYGQVQSSPVRVRCFDKKVVMLVRRGCFGESRRSFAAVQGSQAMVARGNREEHDKRHAWLGVINSISILARGG